MEMVVNAAMAGPVRDGGASTVADTEFDTSAPALS